MAYDYIIKAGATSQIIDVMLRSSSTGAGVTGVAHTDVTASYLRPGGTRTAITLAAGTAGDAYSSGKWAEVDATNTPGLYQFHIPDAAIAAGVIGSTLFFKGASFISVVKKVVLVAYDPQDATALGISRIDATVSSRSSHTAANVRSEIDSNSTQLAAIVADTNELQTNQGNWLTATGFSTHSAADVWSVATRSLTTFGSLAGDVADAVWTTLTSTLTAAGTIGKLLVDNINATISSRSTYAGADTAGTTTLLSRIIGTLAAGTHNAQSGDSYARLGAPAGASVSADVAAVKTDTGAIKTATDRLPLSPASTDDIPLPADVATSVWANGTATTLTGNVTTLLNRLGAITGTGVNTILGYFKALLSKSASTPSDIGGTFSAATDSTEAIRDQGDASWGAGAAPSSADNAAAVWDLAIAGHTTAGSTGEKLNAAGASGDFLASAVPGAYADGTAGAALGNIPAIKAKTDLLAAATAPEIRAGVTSAGDVYLYLGADHSADDMAWIFTDAGDWPDLTGLTVLVNIRKTDTTLLQLTPTVTGEGTANQVIRAEPTAAQTAGFTIGRKSYAVWVTNGGGDTWPIFSGDVLVENLPH